MSRINLILTVIFLIIALLIIGVTIKYANTPMSELPFWVYFLTK